MCNLLFDTPVVMKTCNGEVLCNPSGIDAALSKSFEGDNGGLVQLIRNTDGTVAIQSMRNGLHLSIEDEVCAFNSAVVDDSAKFTVSLMGSAFFAFESVEGDRIGGDGSGELQCSGDNADGVGPFEEAWVLEFIPPAKATSLLSTGGVMTDEGLKERRENIMRLVIEGHLPFEEIDSVLTRMYGFKMPPGMVVEADAPRDK